MPSDKRIPFLDGLRTLAVLLVVNHHVGAAFDSTYLPTRYTSFPLTINGWMGVDLFFVLSGFFIGSQLWKELSKTGTVRLGDFMLRRTLRIWPLYFATYIAALALLPHFGAAKQYGWADVVFLVNYLDHGVVLGGWSLSTEEQERPCCLQAPVLPIPYALRRADRGPAGGEPCHRCPATRRAALDRTAGPPMGCPRGGVLEYGSLLETPE